MVRTFGSLLGVSKQTEMLVMTVLTLWANIFDMALFELTSNLEQVWNVSFDVTKFSPEAQSSIKILLSGVVFVRTFSLHMYIAFLIALIWPASFGTRPTLMLPWLTVSAIKNIGAGIVTLTMGIYTCIMYGPVRPACLRFFGSQMLDLSPSFYMWIVGISLYRDLRKPIPVDKVALKLTEEEELNVALRRRKVKSMVDEDILRKQFESRRKFIGTSAVEVKEIFTPSCFEETMNMKISRSLDSLLDAMTAEAEILEAEDFEPLEDGLNLSEKTAKLLGITMSEISRIKQNKHPLLFPVQSQRKQSTDPFKSTSISKTESPIIRLLPETSLYTPNSRPVRSTKSELKSPKDFLKMKSPSDFMACVPENELKILNYNQEPKKSDICLTETIFANKNLSNNEQEDNASDDVLKRDQDTFINNWEMRYVDDANKFDEENKLKEDIKNSSSQPIYPEEQNKSKEHINNSNLESVELKKEEMEFIKADFEENEFTEEEFVETKLEESEIVKNEYEEIEFVENKVVENEVVQNELVENEIIENEIIENEIIENEIIENESVENEIMENESVESVIIENERVESGIIENKHVESEIIENESLSIEFEENEVIENEFDEIGSEEQPIVKIYENARKYNETPMENKDLPVKKDVKEKHSHEIGCQVSTLSKRILDATPEEISKTLSNLPHSKSPKSRGRPPSSSSQKNKISFRKSKSFISKNSLDTSSPREHNSYLNIHLNKLAGKNAKDKKKFNIDKFGVISNASSDSGSRVDISSFFNPYDSDESITKKKFDNFKFKY